MDLFEVDENDYTCKLNRTWIWLIPEFADIMRRDKGSTGDKGGARKMWARKRFAYIYFYIDFKSPIFSWEEEPKKLEALRYTGLVAADIKEDYMVKAIEVYKELQLQAARSLRTLSSVKKGLDALDDYFENIDFEKTDKQGKALYSAKEFIDNTKRLNEAYDAINSFEKRVMAELTKSGGIRGSATKGDREVAKQSAGVEGNWEEGASPLSTGPSWLDMATGEKPEP